MNRDDGQTASCTGDAGAAEGLSGRFPTIGIGTSAGGVRALQIFFESLPGDVNAAFVVVAHLDPAHQSELPNIIAARTRMPVAKVTGRIPLEPGRVYVVPPNRQLLVADQHLAIAEFHEPRWQQAPIDLFFRSLAAQRGDDFAIVLSGAESDGSLGVKAMKEAGGIILVQDPEEAEYGSMPRSAIATGLADLVLPVREIAARLRELVGNRGRVDIDVRVTPRIGPLGFGAEPLPTRTPAPFRTPSEGVMHRRALERLAPPSALVDESYRVIHLSELAGRYLQPSGGILGNDLVELAREELRFDLRVALHRVFGRDEPSLRGPIAVRFNGGAKRVYLQGRPVSVDANASRSAIVFFFEGETFGDPAIGAGAIEERAPSDQIQQLQQELQFSQSQLRKTYEEYEGANEKLRAANEELQSINEELETVNSELKTSRENVSRAHGDIQNLMAATDAGILFLDAQLRINRFTPRIAELFNITAGDEGRSITDFTHRLEYEGLAEDTRKVLLDLAFLEREVRSRTGGWYLMRLKPYRTVEDRIDGVVVTFVDIGQRRRAEDALRDSEARMCAVINGVAVAMIIIDEHGTIQSINAATTTMLGYSADELIGQNVKALAPEPHHTQHDDYIKNYIRTGDAKIIGGSRDVEARRKDGSQFPVELMVSEVRYGDERLFIGFLRDPSERRRFEARLGRLHGNPLDSMADMAAALAHELNQPLAAASNYLSAARHMVGARTPSPAVDEALDKALSQMLRAGQIVSRLREFMAQGEPDKVEQSLHALIRRACELVGPSANEANVEIVLLLNAAEDIVLAERVQIEQAIVNLMRNAIEAMAESRERKLTISTVLNDGMIHTNVADTGPGLTDAPSSELFAPFTSTKKNGLGVGLSISRSIIEAHYGSIWAAANPGGGAKFGFTLPLARFEDAAG
jgi:two-component system CheB/CheR fusion protein